MVHKGNIMKFTEGAFRDWGYALAKREYAGRVVGWDDCAGKPPAGTDPAQGLHRRHHLAAGADPARRVRGHRDHEPERRLPVGRAGGAGGRHRHRAGREHQLPDRARGVRGHARHGAEVRQSGQGESRFGDSVGHHDAGLPRLDRRRCAHRHSAREDHRAEDRDLRLRAPHRRRDRSPSCSEFATRIIANL
jgi:hypothetical protein